MGERGPFVVRVNGSVMYENIVYLMDICEKTGTPTWTTRIGNAKLFDTDGDAWLFLANDVKSSAYRGRWEVVEVETKEVAVREV